MEAIPIFKKGDIVKYHGKIYMIDIMIKHWKKDHIETIILKNDHKSIQVRFPNIIGLEKINKETYTQLQLEL